MFFTIQYIKPGLRDCKYGHDWQEWKDSNHIIVGYGYAFSDQSRRCFRCGKWENRMYNKTGNISMESAKIEHEKRVKKWLGKNE